MIDTHAHLDFKDFDKDHGEVISRFFRNEPRLPQGFGGRGKAIINVGVDLERSRKSIEIAENHKGVFASVGLHPDFFTKGNQGNQGNWGNIFDELKKLAKNEKVVAIGECGLDYFHIAHNMPARFESRSESGGEHGTADIEEIKNNQKRGFIAQIEIAKDSRLPVIVHCRDAWKDLYEVISSFLRLNLKNRSSTSVSSKVRPSPLAPREEWGSSKPSFPKFVLHCYSGERKDTEKFLELPNVYFSFSGNITYPKPADRAEKLAEAVRMIPFDRIMLDSDSPFLAPQEFRGKRNEPMNVSHIAEKIAEIKGISPEEVEIATDKNASEFFGLD